MAACRCVHIPAVSAHCGQAQTRRWWVESVLVFLFFPKSFSFVVVAVVCRYWAHTGFCLPFVVTCSQSGNCHDYCYSSWLSFKESKFASIAKDVTDPVTHSSSKFSCLVCAVCVDYNVSRWLNPNFLEHYFTLIISGMASVVQVFVVSSIAACVGKGRIRAAIFIRHLGCTSGGVYVPCIFTHAR